MSSGSSEDPNAAAAPAAADQSPPGRSGLSKPQTRASLASFTWYESFRSIYALICGGTTFVFVGFARSLGISPENIGLVQSLVSVAAFVPLVLLPLTNGVADKRRLILRMTLIDPLLMAMAVLLVSIVPPGAKVAAFAAAVFFSAVLQRMAQPFADEWVASTIPAGLRGRYLGRKLGFICAAMLAALLSAGWAMDSAGRTNTRAIGFILIAGALCGLVGTWGLRNAAMPALSLDSRVLFSDMLGIFRERRFRRTMMAMALFNVPFYFACPYYQVFHLDVAQMPPFHISVMLSGYWLVKLLAAPLMGRLLGRVGPRAMVLAAGPLYALFFSIYLLAGPGRYWPLMVSWSMVALADTATNVAMPSALYASVPATRARPAYFLAYSILTIGLFAFGGAIAAPVLTAIRDFSVTVGPLHLGNFHLLYGACCAMMLLSTSAAWMMPRSTDRS